MSWLDRIELALAIGIHVVLGVGGILLIASTFSG